MTVSSVLITGASRGLGLEFVRRYCKVGWEVYACCREPERAAQLHALAQAYPRNVTVVALDVVNDGDIGRLAEHFKQRSLDLLINNAGVDGQMHGRFGSTSVSAWIETLKVNTIAPLKIMEAMADAVARSDRKLMIAMSSRLGSMALNACGGSYVYRSSKAALNAVVRSAAVDLKALGITVVALHPGHVKTDMGGADAPLDAASSVAHLCELIDRLTLADSGSFINYDGVLLPW